MKAVVYTRYGSPDVLAVQTGPPLRRVTEPARALGMSVLATARQAQRERQPSGKPTTSPPRVIPPEYGPDTIQRPRPNTPEGQWSTNTTCNGPPPAALPHR